MSIVLDATTKKLEIVLAGAVAANQLVFVASYADYDDSTPGFVPGGNDGVTNDTTPVTLVAAPASGKQRLVNNISVWNKDTATATVTIQLDNDGTDREIIKLELSVGYSLHFREDQWQVLNSSGAVQVAMGGVALDELESYARGSIIRGGAADWEAYDAKTNHFVLVGDGTDIASKAFDWDDVAAGEGGEIPVASLGSYAQGSIMRGGAADWEAHDAKTNHFILVGDGTDIVSKAFDWDDMAAGAGADMAHDHSAAGEGGEVPVASLGSYAQGSIMRGGAADWEAHDAKTNHFILVGDGTDIVSKAFDWDDVAAGAAADMVHSHQAAGEGGQVDHGAALTGLGDDDHTQYLLADGSRGLSGAWAPGQIITMPNQGLHLLDTNASHDLVIAPGSDLTQDRVLTLTTGDVARTITLSGNPTLADWFDQSVKQAASPTFADVFTTDGGTFGISGNELLTVNGAGTFGFSGITGITVEDTDWVGIGPAAERLIFNAAGNISVMGATFNVGVEAGDGTCHIHTATAGAVTAHADADDLVVENDAAGGMSILVPDASVASIKFGSPSGNQGAIIAATVNGANSYILWYAGGAWRLYLDANGHFRPYANKTQDVGVAATAWDDGYADDWHNVADTLFLDELDDLALICAIKPSKEVDKHGRQIVDDTTLPSILLTLGKDHQPALGPDGKPYVSQRAFQGLVFGAFKEVADRLTKLEGK